MAWPVPCLIIAAVIFAMLYQNLWRPMQVAAAIVAVICAILFVFPGSIMMIAGACGIVNSTCSADETFWGITGFAVATLVNFAAVALLVWRLRDDATARSS